MDSAKEMIASTLAQNNKNIAVWGGFLTASLVVYFLFSSGDFSFMLVVIQFRVVVTLMYCSDVCILYEMLWLCSS